ncbi:MAG: FHA domain-containing protein [Phycisphaerae bacterium]|jgi:hypothetical protein
MLFRWRYSALYAAEKALDRGLLDEAFERLREIELAADSRAQALADELARRLLARARLAAQGGDYAAALRDAERLAQLGRLDGDGQALRARAEQVLGEAGVQRALTDAALRRAAETLEQGRLDSARLAVEGIRPPAQQAPLRDQLDARRARSDALIELARGALQAGDPFAAVRLWSQASSQHGRTAHTDAAAAEIARAFEQQIDQHFEGGRLDRVRDAFDAASPLREHWARFREFERLVGLLRRAASLMDAMDYAALHEALLRLRAVKAGVGWVDSLMRSVGALADARQVLLASPLGLLARSLYESPLILSQRHIDREESEPAAPRSGRDVQRRADLRPLLLVVEGVGSFLLSRSELVRIGRAHGTGLIDVPIPADVQSHHADIVREGDDYFLVAHGPARVNQNPAMKSLLRDGDRIVLGTSAKMVFRRPSLRSGTAVVTLAANVRLPLDVSAVILFRDACIIGPHSCSHIRTREGQTRLVIHEQGGGLCVRLGGENGQRPGPAEPLAIGTTNEFGDLRITVKPYEAAGPGGLA